MAEITVATGGGGDIAFCVSFMQPMRAEFATRQEAEQFRAALRLAGLTVDVDGTCGPCAAHHASGHDCPSCGADLSLRVAPPPGRALPQPVRVTVPPDRFLVPREQQRIRIELEERARQQWLEEVAAADQEIEMAVTS